MAVTVETLDKLERKMTLTLPVNAIQSEVDSRLKKLARTVKMDGFRPGKVPLSVVAQRYGYSVQCEVLNDTVGEAVAQLVPAFEQTVARGVDTRARMALSIDCLSDPELHELLTTSSPVRAKLVTEATAMLTSLGVDHPDARAVDFIAVMNGLLYDRLVGNGVRGAPADATAVLTAWLTGLGART